jgi:hypothetical protein
MTITTPAAPPLPDEVDALLRRLRMPYVRHAAPDVLATAKSQRWDPAEVLRVLLTEEAAGRDRATIRMRRRASGLPARKTFDAWNQDASPIPTATQQSLKTLERGEAPGLRRAARYRRSAHRTPGSQGRTRAVLPATVRRLLRESRCEQSLRPLLSPGSRRVVAVLPAQEYGGLPRSLLPRPDRRPHRVSGDDEVHASEGGWSASAELVRIAA